MRQSEVLDELHQLINLAMEREQWGWIEVLAQAYSNVAEYYQLEENPNV